jgi:FAD/FMN-containing dehydrogenase
VVVKICADRGVPVIPFGTGTGVEGHTLADLHPISETKKSGTGWSTPRASRLQN